MNLLRVTKQTHWKRHIGKSLSWQKLQLGKAFRGSTMHHLKLPMTSIYGHCWREDAMIEEASTWAHMAILTVSRQVFSWNSQCVECKHWPAGTILLFLPEAPEGLHSVYYRFYYNNLKMLSSKTPKGKVTRDKFAVLAPTEATNLFCRTERGR